MTHEESEIPRYMFYVDDARLGFKKGEIYRVKLYPYDEKLSAVDADFNVYLESCGTEWEYCEPLNAKKEDEKCKHGR